MKQQQSWMREPAKAFRMFLVVVLALRIVSYFMLSDSLFMVQAIKSGLRLFLTVTLLVAIFLEARREHRF